MNGDHPWLDWLKVLIIFLGGLAVVMLLVRLLINWAHRDDKPPNGNHKDGGGTPAG